jgi:hypothetical protein
MAAANPGDGASWRYARPVRAARPKAGSSGTGAYWRYARPARVYSVAPAGTLEALAATIAAVSGVSVALTVLKRLAAALGGASTASAALTVTHTTVSHIDGSKAWRYGRPARFLIR